MSGAGYVDGLGVGNQLLELVDGGLGDHVGQEAPYEKCWGIDPSGSVDQQVADCVELLRSRGRFVAEEVEVGVNECRVPPPDPAAVVTLP